MDCTPRSLGRSQPNRVELIIAVVGAAAPYSLSAAAVDCSFHRLCPRVLRLAWCRSCSSCSDKFPLSGELYGVRGGWCCTRCDWIWSALVLWARPLNYRGHVEWSNRFAAVTNYAHSSGPSSRSPYPIPGRFLPLQDEATDTRVHYARNSRLPDRLHACG